MGKTKIVWPKGSRSSDFQANSFNDHVEGQGANRLIPKVQVPIKANWTNFDPGLYKSVDPEKDGSYSSQDAALDLTPLTMDPRKTGKRDALLPVVPAALRQFHRHDHWKVEASDGTLRQQGNLAILLASYPACSQGSEVLPYSESLNDTRDLPAELAAQPSEIMLDRILVNGSLGIQDFPDFSRTLSPVHTKAIPILNAARKSHTPHSISHTRTSEVPEHVRTAEDAVAFFMNSASDKGLLILCNYRQQESLEYDPYDLVVVDHTDMKSEYFIVSDRGITHVKPKQASNLTAHQEWLEEKRLFLLLKQTTFFGKNTLIKWLRRWRESVLTGQRILARKNLEQNSFQLSPFFAQLSAKIQHHLAPLISNGVQYQRQTPGNSPVKWCPVAEEMSTTVSEGLATLESTSRGSLASVLGHIGSNQSLYSLKEFTALREKVCNFVGEKVKVVARVITTELSKAKETVCDNLLKVSPSRSELFNWRSRPHTDIPSATWKKKSVSSAKSQAAQDEQALSKVYRISEQFKRFVRKVDIMLLESLLSLGQEACENAMTELRASRRQGLFEIVGQMIKTDPAIEQSLHQSTSEESFSFSPSQQILSPLVASVPKDIVDLLARIPRVILSPEFDPHSTEWKKLVVKGRISSTGSLLHSKIRVDDYSAEIAHLVADGYTAAAMDTSASASAFLGCGNIFAFACGFSHKSYLEGGPSSEDYLNDIQCLELWIVCLSKAKNVLCKGIAHVDLQPLKQRMLSSSELALRSLESLAEHVLKKNCEMLMLDLKEFTAGLENIPTALPDFCNFVEKKKEHLLVQGKEGLYINSRFESVQTLYHFLRQKSLASSSQGLKGAEFDFKQTQIPDRAVKLPEEWNTLLEWMQRYKSECTRAKIVVDNLQTNMMEECVQVLEKLKGDAMSQLARLRKGKLVDINCNIEVALRDINNHRTGIERMRSTMAMHSKYCLQLQGTRLLPAIQDMGELIEVVQEVVETRAAFWSRKGAWQQKFESLCAMDVLTKIIVDISQLGMCMEAMIEAVARIQLMDHENEDLADLTAPTQQEVNLAAGTRNLAVRWEKDVVYLRILFDPVLKCEHRLRLLRWMDLEVSTRTQSVISGCSTHEVRVSVALFLARARQLENSHILMNEILNLAHEEKKLANDISNACKSLHKTQLDITNDCVDCRLVKNLTLVKKSVDDMDRFLQEIAESPWATGVIDPLISARQQVSEVSKTIQETIQFQDLYMLLWGVFSSVGTRTNLPIEYSQFRDCQSSWFDVLQSCLKFKGNLVPCTTKSDCLLKCNALCKRLKEVLHYSYRVLVPMRELYPRLNFVDDNQLFESLRTQSIESGPLLKVVRTIFPGVHSLAAEDVKAQKVLRIIEGCQGERFRLITGVGIPVDGRPHEEFLKELGDALTTSVFEWTRQCLEAWEKFQESKPGWLSSYPCQALILADCVEWTKDVETCFDISAQSQATELSKLRAQCISAISALGKKIYNSRLPMVGKSAPVDVNVQAECQQGLVNARALLSSKICHREILSELIEKEVYNVEQFEWFSQLRHYWKPRIVGTNPVPTLHVQIGDIFMDHAYEYHSQEQDFSLLGVPVKSIDLIAIASGVGNSSCTCLTSPRYNAGHKSAAFIPSMHTWTIVKATAVAFGRCCVEVNCCGSVAMKKLIEQVITGIVASGAWAVFARSELLNPFLVPWLHSQVVLASRKNISRPAAEVDNISCMRRGPGDFMLFLCESGQNNCFGPEPCLMPTSCNSCNKTVNDRSIRTIGIRVREAHKLLLEIVLRNLGLENCVQGSKIAMAMLHEAQERLPKRSEYSFSLNSVRDIARILNQLHTQAIHKDADCQTEDDSYSLTQSLPQIGSNNSEVLVWQAMKRYLQTVLHPEDKHCVEEIAEVFSKTTPCKHDSLPRATCGEIDWEIWPQSMQKVFGDNELHNCDKEALVENAQLLLQCLMAQKMAVILGNPGGGKSTCQRYLQAVLKEHGKHIEVSRVYHGTLTIEELWGQGFQCASQQDPVQLASCRSFVARLINLKLSENKISTEETTLNNTKATAEGPSSCAEGGNHWLILDGNVVGEAADSLCCLFERIRSPSILRSMVNKTDQHCILWETDSLKDASPTLCNAPIAHMKLFKCDFYALLKMELSNYWKSPSDNRADQSITINVDDFCDMVKSIMDNTCPRTSTSISLVFQHVQTTWQKEQVVQRILAIFMSLAKEIQQAKKTGLMTTNLVLALVYSLAWGIGCSTHDKEMRSYVDSIIRTHVTKSKICISLPEESIFDCILNVESGRLDVVSPQIHLFFPHEFLTLNKCKSHFLLPSRSLASTLYAGNIFLQAGLNIVFSGQQCSGKTTIARILYNHQGRRKSRASLQMTPGLSPADAKRMLISQIHKNSSGAKNFLSSEHLVWVDDLFNSLQPPEVDQIQLASSHEVIREFTDSMGLGGVDGKRIEFLNAQLLGATRCSEPPQGTRRLWSKLDVLAVPSSFLSDRILSPCLDATCIGSVVEGFCTGILQDVLTNAALRSACQSFERIFTFHTTSEGKRLSMQLEFEWIVRTFRRLEFLVRTSQLSSNAAMFDNKHFREFPNQKDRVIEGYVAIATAQALARELYDKALEPLQVIHWKQQIQDEVQQFLGVTANQELCQFDVFELDRTVDSASMLDLFSLFVRTLEDGVQESTNPWTQLAKLSEASPTESSEHFIQDSLIHEAFAMGEAQSRECAMLPNTKADHSWLKICRRKRRSSAFSRSIRVLQFNLRMPWHIGNTLLVGNSCRENLILAKLATNEIKAQWLAPELSNFEDPSQCLNRALSRAASIITNQQTSVILYLNKSFLKHNSILALVVNILDSHARPCIITEAEYVQQKVGFPSLSPQLNSVYSQEDGQSWQAQLRFILSVDQDQYKQFLLKSAQLLRQLSVMVMPPAQDIDNLAYCIRAVDDCMPLLTCSPFDQRSTRDPTNASSEKGQLRNLDHNIKENKNKNLRFISQNNSMFRAEGGLRDNRLLLAQMVTALHTVTEELLGIPLLQSKMDEVLSTFRHIYSMCTHSLHQQKIHYEHSVDFLGSIVHEMKQGDVEIKDLRCKIKALQHEKQELKNHLLECEKKSSLISAELNEEHVRVSERIATLDADKMRADCEIKDADLKYDQAVVDVLSLAEGDINELKGYSAPPTLVRLIMEGVCVIFDYPPDWPNAKKLLNESNITIKQRMKGYQVGSLSEGKAKKLLRITQHPGFKPETVRLVCGAAESLCSWVLCVAQHFSSSRDAQRRLEGFQKQEEDIRKSHQTLRGLRREVRLAKDNFDELKKQYDDNLNAADSVDHTLQQMLRHMEQAAVIRIALENHKTSWMAKIIEIKENVDRLLGNSLLAAFCVVHLGFLNIDSRETLTLQWLEELEKRNILTSSQYTISKFLQEHTNNLHQKFWPPAVIASEFLKENLCLVGLAPNVPLLIDPDKEAIALIKSLDPNIQWKTVSADSPSAAEDIMRAIDSGGKVLVDLHNLDSYNQALHDVVMQFQAANLEPSDEASSTDLLSVPSFHASWTIEDKKLFFFTRDPGFASNDWTNGIHTTVRFATDQNAVYSRLESIILQSVCPDVDMEYRQIKGELERIKNDKDRIASSLVACISEAETNAMRNVELLSILSEATAKLASLESSIERCKNQQEEMNHISDSLSPVVQAVSSIRSKMEDIAELFLACSVSLVQFRHLLRAALSASLEDPDLLRDLEEMLREARVAGGINVSLNEVPSDRNSSRKTRSKNLDTCAAQFLLSVCGHLTLGICNLWPEDAAAALKFQVICIYEKKSGGLQEREIDFIHSLLCSIKAPFFSQIEPTHENSVLLREHIEQAVMLSLEESDDFTRAAMLSQQMSLELGKGRADPNRRLRDNVLWLETAYPSDAFKGISSSFEEKFMQFCWKAVAMDRDCFDPHSPLIPEEWRSRLSPVHLGILTHALAPDRLSVTISRLWDAVMGPDEQPPSSMKLRNAMSMFPPTMPIAVVSQGTADSMSLLQRVCASKNAEEIQLKGEKQLQTSELQFVSARSLTHGVADAVLLQAIDKKKWIALTDPWDNFEICDHMLSLAASIPWNSTHGFRLFICMRTESVAQVSGAIRHQCVHFHNGKPTSLRLELIKALETMSCLDVSTPQMFESDSTGNGSDSRGIRHLQASHGILVTARKRLGEKDSMAPDEEFTLRHSQVQPATQYGIFSMHYIWRKLSFGLGLAHACCAVLHGGCHAVNPLRPDDLLRGVQCIWRVLSTTSSRGLDVLDIGMSSLRTSLQLIAFPRVNTELVHELLDSFLPDNICTDDSYPWKLFNRPAQDEPESVLDPEALPTQGTLMSFKQYIENHLMTGNQTLLEICPSHAHEIMAQRAKETIDVWCLLLKTVK